jgi:hypothetical protein
MPTVQIPFDNLTWLQRCCRCGNTAYDLRAHNEKVVTRTLLAATEFREVTLTIPVCSRCARLRFYWFGAALAFAAAGGAFLWLNGNNGDAWITWVMWSFILAVTLAWMGVYQQPLRVLGFNDQMRLLTARIYDAETAAHMARLTEALLGKLRTSGKHMQCTRCGNWVEAPRAAAAGTFRCGPCATARRRRRLLLIAFVLVILGAAIMNSGAFF